jgi:phosphopentomutase
VLERLGTEIRPPWDDSVFDAFVFRRSLQYLQDSQPRVLFVGLGDTDEWAHARRYDRYLQAIHRADGWLRELWEKLQSLPGYRGQTSLVITVDHGRGDNDHWHSHGFDVPGSEAVWIAVLGPTVPALGERQSLPTLTLAQVATTLATLVGQNFAAAAPRAAPPLPLAGR